jgi:hypothetical protein
MSEHYKREVWVISLDIPKHIAGRIDIWLDPVKRQYFIGPPDGIQGPAMVLMQVDGPQFIHGMLSDDSGLRS